jgi:hypothetical protein
MKRPETPFFLAAAAAFGVSAVLVLLGAPLALRVAVSICALLLMLIGGRRRSGGSASHSLGTGNVCEAVERKGSEDS